MAFAIYTGLRLEAILELRIEDVQMYNAVSISRAIVKDKGGNRVERILSKYPTEILSSSIGERRTGYASINPRTGKRYTRRLNSFDKAVNRLGLKAKDGSKLRFHNLRHVYGNCLHKAGVSLDELRVLYDDRDIATTARYITPDIDLIEKNSSRLAARLNWVYGRSYTQKS